MESNLVEITLNVNGIDYHAKVKPNTTLLELIREDLKLMGTKKGCDSGHCGTCTVIMDGKAINSCLVLAVQADKKKIVTIEGLLVNGNLHPLQKAFIDEGAVQCGFCTPGMILSAKALLDEVKDPSEDMIKVAVSGNICRCTGYVKIIKAVKKASKEISTNT